MWPISPILAIFSKFINNHFKLFLNAWHVVQFQKNLMNKFREISKMLINF